MVITQKNKVGPQKFNDVYINNYIFQINCYRINTKFQSTYTKNIKFYHNFIFLRKYSETLYKFLKNHQIFCGKTFLFCVITIFFYVGTLIYCVKTKNIWLTEKNNLKKL